MTFVLHIRLLLCSLSDCYAKTSSTKYTNYIHIMTLGISRSTNMNIMMIMMLILLDVNRMFISKLISTCIDLVVDLRRLPNHRGSIRWMTRNHTYHVLTHLYICSFRWNVCVSVIYPEVRLKMQRKFL